MLGSFGCCTILMLFSDIRHTIYACIYVLRNCKCLLVEFHRATYITPRKITLTISRIFAVLKLGDMHAMVDPKFSYQMLLIRLDTCP